MKLKGLSLLIGQKTAIYIIKQAHLDSRLQKIFALVRHKKISLLKAFSNNKT
jgi:hypothetical protein